MGVTDLQPAKVRKPEELREAQVASEPWVRRDLCVVVVAGDHGNSGKGKFLCVQRGASNANESEIL